jgi:hypothetical protein
MVETSIEVLTDLQKGEDKEDKARACDIGLIATVAY